MPWKGVTVTEERQRFLEDYRLKSYSIAELAERFGVSRKTAYTHPGHQGKRIDRFEQYGQAGYQEQSRRPHSCLWQTRAGDRPGACAAPPSPPPLGAPQAAEHGAAAAPGQAAPGAIDGGPDLGPPRSRAHPAGASRLPEDGAAGDQ